MIQIEKPEQECDDPNCPFHGTLSVRGRMLIGDVISDRMNKSVVIRIAYTKYISKYERYTRMSHKITAHTTPCLNVTSGDRVRIAECRPLSKTKSFVVVEKIEGMENE
jgi:small subunit ribosomal protein S17